MAEGTQVGKAFIAIGADGSTITRDMDGIKGTVLGALKSFAGPIAAALSVTGFTAIIKDAANFGDQMVKTSQKVGIAIGDLQRIKYVADLSGVSFQGMTTAMKTFATKMVETGKATGSMADMLAGVADEFANMADGPAKTAKAVELFGRAGLDMIPMLNQGSEAIRAQSKELDQLGAVMSTQTAKQSEMLNDNISRLQTALRGLGFTVAEAVIPALADVTGKIVDWWKANQEVINQGINTFIDDVKVSVNNLSTALGAATSGMGGFSNIAEKAGGVVKFFSLALMGIEQAFVSLTWLGLQPAVIGLENLEKAVRFAEDSLNSLLGITELSAQSGRGNSFANWIRDTFVVPVSGFATRMGEMKDEINKAIVDTFFPLDSMLSAHAPKAETVGKAFEQMGNGIKGATKELQALNFEGNEFWSWYGQLLTGTGLPGMAGIGAGMGGTAGQELVPDISGIVGELQSVRSQFQTALGGPSWSVTGFAEGEDPGQAIGLMLFGVPSLGGAIQTWIDSVNMVNAAPMESKLQSILDSVAAFGVTWGEVAQFAGDGISSFFSDAVVSGFGAGAKKLIAAMIGVFGQIISKFGTALIGEGIAAIIMGMNPLFPRPDLVAWGKVAIVKGAFLAAGGGIMSGVSSVIGGTSSGAAGESFQSGIARPVAPTVTPVEWATSSAAAAAAAGGGGGSTTNNYYVNAIDTQSFDDALRKRANTVEGIVGDGVKSNGRLRSELGLIFGA